MLAHLQVTARLTLGSGKMVGAKPGSGKMVGAKLGSGKMVGAKLGSGKMVEIKAGVLKECGNTFLGIILLHTLHHRNTRHLISLPRNTIRVKVSTGTVAVV